MKQVTHLSYTIFDEAARGQTITFAVTPDELGLKVGDNIQGVPYGHVFYLPPAAAMAKIDQAAVILHGDQWDKVMVYVHGLGGSIEYTKVSDLVYQAKATMPPL